VSLKRTIFTDEHDAFRDTCRTFFAKHAVPNNERWAKEGIVEAYVHGGGRIGALVELSSETDFVARNNDFRELAREIAMQVAAMDPQDIDELLAQAYIRDASKTIGELVTTLASTTGENVRVRRFARFQLGGSNGEAA